ncbi:MAG TPA: M56 family metallopeptidase [Verrucomicrobiae bacterium]|nr:M56 family metallopeptidase [Verrucomicrobiae bacterium]
MSDAPILTVWLQLLGLLASEVALVVVAAVLLQRSTKSAWWRRTIWQVCVLSLLALPLFELSGAARGTAGWLGRIIRIGNGGSETGIAAGQSGGRVPAPPVTDEFRPKVAEQFALNRQRETTAPSKTQSAVTLAQGPHPEAGLVTASDPKRNPIRLAPPENFSVPDSIGVLWLGLIWLTGAGLVTARSCAARVLCALFRRRRRAVRDADLQNRAEVLARLLGINRRICLVESARLSGPIVYGVLRPAIGLPAGFTKRFDTARQEAMLAHELAHLAENDPFWYLLADLAAAIFWWHPLVWWARRRLHAASEMAADEASLLVANGPGLLARCLVELGAQMTQGRTFAWLGVEGSGFRSGLGRRVERLVNLNGRSWCPPDRLRSIFAKTVGPTALIAAVILCTAWVGPQALNKGESMKTMKQTWKRSLAAFALLASLGTDNNIAPAASADNRPIDKKAVPTDTKPTPAGDKPAAPDLASDPSAEESSRPTPFYYNRLMLDRYGLMPKGSAQAANPPTTVSPNDLMRRRYGLPAAKKEKGRVESKLEEIVLDEVMFDGTPLPEVLKSLDEESRKRDPEKQGINFLINPNATQAATTTAIDPNTGQPIQSPPSEPLDMNSVIVRFNLPLRNVRLKDVLDAVVKVADKPIEYSIEDYGVIFSQSTKQSDGSGFIGASGSMSLQVRTFKVEADKLLPGMERAFGITSDPEKIRQTISEQEKSLAELLTRFTDKHPLVEEQREAIHALKESLKRKLSAQDGKAPETQVALRRLLTQLGINMDVPGKAVFYNDLTGILMVRATSEDLEIVKAAIETLGGSTGEQTAPQASAKEGSVPFYQNEMMMRRYGLLPPKK